MLEPMSLSKSVIIGPYAFNFKEIVQSGKEKQALLEVKDEKELLETIKDLLKNPEKQVQLNEKAHVTATSEMAVLDRLYQCLKERGIVA